MSEEERQTAIDRLEEQIAAAGNLDFERPPNCATRCWLCAAKSRWPPTKILSYAQEAQNEERQDHRSGERASIIWKTSWNCRATASSS